MDSETRDSSHSQVSDSPGSFQARYVNFSNRSPRFSGKQVVISARMKNDSAISSWDIDRFRKWKEVKSSIYQWGHDTFSSVFKQIAYKDTDIFWNYVKHWIPFAKSSQKSIRPYSFGEEGRACAVSLKTRKEFAEQTLRKQWQSYPLYGTVFDPVAKFLARNTVLEAHRLKQNISSATVVGVQLTS